MPRVNQRTAARRSYLYVRVSPERKAKLKRHIRSLQEEGNTPYRPDLRRTVAVHLAEWIDSLPD